MNTRTLLLAGIALAAITFAVSPTTARADETRAMHTTGFYAGGFGGYGWTSADFSGGPTLDANGADWGLFAGYDLGAMLGTGLTGALEFEYSWSGADKTNAAAAVAIDKDHEWGISFRPGLSFISDASPLGAKPYGILGYRRTEYTQTTGGGSSSDNYDGFEVGIGTELVAYQNYGVRLDYSHVFYNSENGLDPDENDLRLGVAYHF